MDTVQHYRCSFTSLFLWLMVVLLPMSFFIHLAASDFSVETAAAQTSFTAVGWIALLTALVLWWALKSEVSSFGILSYTAVGFQRFITWENIKSASPTHLLGLGFLRVSGNDGETVYVPRFLSRQREFDFLVPAITKEDNPIRATIESTSPYHRNPDERA